MEQRPLGHTGLMVSALGYGCGAVGGLMVRGDPAEQRRGVAHALEAGITYFDTAPLYGNGRSEENLGLVLGELNAWDRVVVGTKVRLAPAERADARSAIRRSIEASLRRLGRDAIDLLQLHNAVLGREPGAVEGGGIPLDEVRGAILEELQAIRRDGLARHVGCTGLGDTAALHNLLGDETAFETVQSYVNVLNPSAVFSGAVAAGDQDFAGLIPAAARAGKGVIAIRVYAAGSLSGSPERPAIAGSTGGLLAGGGGYEADLIRARGLAALVADLGLESPFELGLRFALGVPGVSTALVGLSDVGQLDNAIRWAERGPLSQEAMQRIISRAA